MLMEQQWITARQAAEWLDRSVHIIYTWIRKTREGRATWPLLLKLMPGNNRSWMIENQSLLAPDGSSSRRRPYVKKDPGSSKAALTTGCHVEEDTRAEVQADRKRWVEGWVTEGKPLDKVLAVFPTSLHAQI